MNPAATHHTVSTRHDLELAQRYVAYRNAVLWPTRKLQRLLTVGVIAAVGFIFQPGLVRYASWVVALVILFWLLVADAVTARASLVADPARKGRGIEEYQFSSRGFRLDNTSDSPLAKLRRCPQNPQRWTLLDPGYEIRRCRAARSGRSRRGRDLSAAVRVVLDGSDQARC